MVLGIGVVLYLALALLVARFLSISGRWERVIGGLMEADMRALAAAGAVEQSLSVAMTAAPLPAKPVPAAPVGQRHEDEKHDDAKHEEERVLAEVGF